ncbi:MAG: DUF362 domain-containing protein [Kiritimatiellaeota bacterium]|nr:DUF362 domain-containing protein [Kiritimatiellota bacterium]
MSERATVAMVRCADYGDGLGGAVERAFSLMEGERPREPNVADFSGKRVLLKPNLLTDRRPEQAVTTHPEVVRHVIRWFRRRGAEVSVGDSPASTANLQNVWRLSGIGGVCAEEGAPLISFEQAGARLFEQDGFAFSVAQPVLDADLVVNLPKVKSHSLSMLTAAVKNIYGVLPGYSKTMYHRQYPKLAVFGRLVAAIWKVIPPSVTLADGVVGMEGQGPANGRPVPLGFLAASENPFALDRTLCGMLRIDARRVPYLVDGLGGDYSCVGDTVTVGAFDVPSGAHILNILPQRLADVFGKLVWVRPAFSEAACVGCGKCAEACPVHAVAWSEGTRKPVLKRDACISCSCCHEVCPADAIRMTQSRILRMTMAFKGM